MNDLDYRRELRGYLAGFVLALGLTLCPFALIFWGKAGYSTAAGILGICALAQLAVQFRFFLHIDLTRQKREDLLLILFSILLLSIMAGGTIWIIGNLGMRM